MDRTCQAKIETRELGSGSAAELYLTARPSGCGSAADQAEELFATIGETLRAWDGRIFEERIFATAEALRIAAPLRRSAYGALDDGVPPTQLVVPQGLSGEIAGVQLHALNSSLRPQLISPDGGPPCGRIVEQHSCRYISLSGLSGPGSTAPQQAEAMFERARAALAQAGCDLASIGRTWLWLGDILSWYDDFNRVRNQFFTAHGLIDRAAGRVRAPASTGIGIRPAGAAECSLDAYAVVGEKRRLEVFMSGGRQNAAMAYGSAFSRAARCSSPAGDAIFISGTAAIDATGASVHVGDPAKQFEATVANVRAIMASAGATDADVVQAIIYCKTPEVERLVETACSGLPWPRLVLQADVCRPELLVEIEVTAAQAIRS
jgi:enamine deaminase RidA (YjgF/YER057c/UK114 family)